MPNNPLVSTGNINLTNTFPDFDGKKIKYFSYICKS